MDPLGIEVGLAQAGAREKNEKSDVSSFTSLLLKNDNNNNERDI